MTAGKFASQQAVALRLIRDNGEQASLIRKTRAVSGTEPWRVDSSTEETFTVDAVFLGNARIPLPEDSQLERESLSTVLIAGTGISIEPDISTDVIVRQNGDEYDIVGVETLQPNEDVILYKLAVTR